MSENEQNEQKKSFPWTTEGKFSNFLDADALKKKILHEREHFQAKVRLMSDGFIVKSRLDPEYAPKKQKKGKKRGKNDKKGKKDKNERKSP